MTASDIFTYLVEFVMSKIDLANLLGLIGGVFYVASVTLRTMVPLRIAAIASNIFFIGYGLLAKALPTFFMYAVLLPINCVRLYQIQQLIKKVKVASQGDLTMDWLKPFMTRRNFRAGDILFRKGDRADAMYYTVTGRFLVREIGVELPPGRVMGELGFLAPDNKRTATVECLEDGQVLFILYDKVRELYFQDPDFGFYFLKLSSERLLQNIARLEGELESCKARLRQMEEAAAYYALVADYATDVPLLMYQRALAAVQAEKSSRKARRKKWPKIQAATPASIWPAFWARKSEKPGAAARPKNCARTHRLTSGRVTHCTTVFRLSFQSMI